jgi:hypothetical protein
MYEISRDEFFGEVYHVERHRTEITSVAYTFGCYWTGAELALQTNEESP